MRPYKFLSILLTVFSASGCVSIGAHKIQSLESAVEQGYSSVQNLCTEKQNPAACAMTGTETAPVRTVPIMQGVTGEREARVVVFAPKGKNLRYYLQENAQIRSIKYETIRGPGQNKELHHLGLFDLKPKTKHNLWVVGPNAEVWDRRSIRGLDVKKKRPRFAVVSCMDDSLADVQTQIWPELLEQAPDFILMIGDNVYADWSGGKSRPVTAGEQIWTRYGETRSSLEVFRSKDLIPIVATWDDHDFGRNDGDRTFHLKEDALSAFFAFFPQRQPSSVFKNGPGVASWWNVFSFQFALLDDRSFRSPNGLDLEDQTHYGSDQERWLKDGLAAAKTPAFLVSGDQFFGGYHSFESYEGSHPKSFKSQMNIWRVSARVPVVFISGDRHLAEILKVPAEHLGYSTYEITSSGVHAKVFPEAFKKSPSPMQVSGAAGEYNYAILEVMQATKSRLQIDVKSFGLGKKMLFQKTLMVKK